MGMSAGPSPATPPARSGLRGGALAFCVAMYGAWISAAHIPLGAAVEGAVSPTDFTRDFIAAKVLLRGEPVSQLDGERGNAEAVRAGAQPVIIIDGSPFHLHPPPAALPILPLVPLGFRLASAVWLALSIALCGRLAWLLAAVRPGRWPQPGALLALLLVWPPVLTNLQLGQWSIVLATLIAEGHRLWERERPGAAGAYLGAAATLKLTPLALVPFVALRNRRAALVLAGVVVAACVAAFPLGHLDPWIAFARDAGRNTRSWSAWWHNTLSLNGLFARQLVGDRFSVPLIHLPGLARALTIATGAALALTALALTAAGGGEAAAGRDRVREGCRFSLWVILIVVLNPLSWHHYAILLLLPAALILRAAEEGDLAPAERRRLRAVVAAALVVLTVPKETLFLIVRPLPTGPLGSLLLSLHLYAALALFGAAAYAARARGATARAAA